MGDTTRQKGSAELLSKSFVNGTCRERGCTYIKKHRATSTLATCARLKQRALQNCFMPHATTIVRTAPKPHKDMG